MNAGPIHGGGNRMEGWERPTLASDADRDRAADLLNAAFAEGRLTGDEHAERVRAVYAARTEQQLGRLTVDLPQPGGDTTERAVSPGPAWAPDRCLICMLLILFPPAGIAWLLLSWQRARTLSGSPLPASRRRASTTETGWCSVPFGRTPS